MVKSQSMEFRTHVIILQTIFQWTFQPFCCCCCYHPPTKLQEGNVFTGACLSFCSGWVWLLPTIHWSSLYSRDSHPDMGPHCTGTLYQWHLAATTGDLFKLVHFRTPCPPQCWYLVPIETLRLVQVGGMHPTGMLSCYYPQTKFVKVMFSKMSVCPQGGEPGQVPPLGRYTPPDRHTPQAGTPQAFTPPWEGTHWAGTLPPPGQVPPRQVYPPATVHAGIWSTSRRYASHWNAFLLLQVRNG